MKLEIVKHVFHWTNGQSCVALSMWWFTNVPTSEYSAKKGELARQDSIRAKRTFQLWIRNWTTAQNEENNIICQPCTAPHGFNTFFSCYIFNLHYYFLHLSNSVKCCQTTKNISRFEAWIFFLLLKCFLGECLDGNPAKITLLQFTTFVCQYRFAVRN